MKFTSIAALVALLGLTAAAPLKQKLAEVREVKPITRLAQTQDCGCGGVTGPAECEFDYLELEISDFSSVSATTSEAAVAKLNENFELLESDIHEL